MTRSLNRRPAASAAARAGSITLVRTQDSLDPLATHRAGAACGLGLALVCRRRRLVIVPDRIRKPSGRRDRLDGKSERDERPGSSSGIVSTWHRGYPGNGPPTLPPAASVLVEGTGAGIGSLDENDRLAALRQVGLQGFFGDRLPLEAAIAYSRWSTWCG